MQRKLEKNFRIINAKQAKTRIYKNARENYCKPMRPYGSVGFVR
jgi:hypothetical protein